MKILVCGSRTWSEEFLIEQLFQKFPKGTIVVHGGAAGADSLAGKISKSLGFEVRVYPADWKNEGNAAGPIRNSKMLRDEHPDQEGIPFDYAFAFTKNLEESRGTRDMVKKCRNNGLETFVISCQTDLNGIP